MHPAHVANHYLTHLADKCEKMRTRYSPPRAVQNPRGLAHRRAVISELCLDSVREERLRLGRIASSIAQTVVCAAGHIGDACPFGKRHPGASMAIESEPCARVGMERGGRPTNAQSPSRDASREPRLLRLLALPSRCCVAGLAE